MGDKRYEETEREFLSSYSNAKKQKPYSICVHAKEIIKNTNRSESTFHRHYRNVDEIVAKKERRVLKEYRQALKKIRKKNPTPRQIVQNVLLFVRANQDFFRIIFLQNNQEFFEHFMGELKPYIRKNWFYHNNKIYQICVGEIYLIIKNWGNKDFNIDELEKVLNDITYLINSARPRLGPLNVN